MMDKSERSVASYLKEIQQKRAEHRDELRKKFETQSVLTEATLFERVDEIVSQLDRPVFAYRNARGILDQLGSREDLASKVKSAEVRRKGAALEIAEIMGWI